MVRSKNTLTTRFGSTAVFTATRKTRPPNSGMQQKYRCTVASSGSGRTHPGADKVLSIHSILNAPFLQSLLCVLGQFVVHLAVTSSTVCGGGDFLE